MIPITRGDLPRNTVSTLARRQKKVDSASDPKLKAKNYWPSFSGAARENVKSALQAMAPGLMRCMYCEDSMGTDIDHFRPKSDYPENTFVWENYYLACSHCNSNQKRNEFPLMPGGSPGLIDPCADDPYDHLDFSPSTGFYKERDERGEHTIRVFGLNREVCVKGRRNAWVVLESIIVLYANEPERRGEFLRIIREYPFQGVRRHLGQFMKSPNRDSLLSATAVKSLTQYPELFN